MTIITKKNNPDISIVLENVVEITKGDTLFTCAASYDGWYCLNFKTLTGNLIQWDYGKSEEGRKTRDEQYEGIIKK